MRNNMASGWFYSPSQIRLYIATRVTSLRPPRTKMQNPITILKQLDSHQWLMFWAGFLGW
jgi:SHS family lactate transporter-like MFS transporter